MACVLELSHHVLANANYQLYLTGIVVLVFDLVVASSNCEVCL